MVTIVEDELELLLNEIANELSMIQQCYDCKLRSGCETYQQLEASLKKHFEKLLASDLGDAVQPDTDTERRMRMK